MGNGSERTEEGMRIHQPGGFAAVQEGSDGSLDWQVVVGMEHVDLRSIWEFLG